MQKISLVICDDAEYWCTYLQKIIQKAEDMEVVAEARESAECVKLVEKLKPDIVVLDIQMETEEAGIEAIPKLLEVCPELKIIMLTSYDTENKIFLSFANGADDYILKSQSGSDVLDIIRGVYNNTSTLRPEIAKKLTKKTKEIETQQKSLLFIIDKLRQLSTSEFEILQALYFGDDYKTIAEERFVEESTVRRMSSRILQKFGEKKMKKLVANLKEMNVFDLFKIK